MTYADLLDKLEADLFRLAMDAVDACEDLADEKFYRELGRSDGLFNAHLLVKEARKAHR